MESLIAKYEAVNEQHHLSLSRIEELSKEIELHEQAIKQLEEKNKILKPQNMPKNQCFKHCLGFIYYQAIPRIKLACSK